MLLTNLTFAKCWMGMGTWGSKWRE